MALPICLCVVAVIVTTSFILLPYIIRITSMPRTSKEEQERIMRERDDRAMILATDIWPNWPVQTIKRRSGDLRVGWLEAVEIEASKFIVHERIIGMSYNGTTHYEELEHLLEEWQID